ncbi:MULTISPECIES: FAD-binding oxidoreductase [Alcaligenes]|uniref:NAD(P)/FAD-dependent oxidoreductase n=1 Tax=Alcaligenes TaxID=507 RepID=UPI00266D88E2|nr:MULTISPECIES: FAD-binding oxidoreductase [Alcaligenes]
MLISKPTLLNDVSSAESLLVSNPRLWNWRQGHLNEAVAPATYYEASLAPWTRFDPLQADTQCDVLVVGGGLLGASTALHLARSGLDVVLVEKDSIGSAASGRNGGQLTPGLARWEAADMIAHLPLDEARRLWRFASHEAMDLLDQIAQDYELDFDRRRGHLTAAVHAGHMGALVEGADARRYLGDTSVEVVGSYELEQEIRSPLYHGAVVDTLGGQLHPLALLRGLVYGLVQHGGRVYEGSPVEEIEQTEKGALAITPGGTILARQALVLAVHDTTSQFLPTQSNTTVPFYTYVGVTEPLECPVSELLPTDRAVYDTQFQIDYYRAVRQNRLLFGGQGTGTSWSPERINDYLLDRIQTVFPQLEQVQLDFSWSGISDFTLNGATDSRKTEDAVPVYMVHGWSGHGVAQTVRIGKAISDDVMGRNEDFAMLTDITHRSIPLGHQLSGLAIPVVKAAIGMMSAVNPGRLVSF